MRERQYLQCLHYNQIYDLNNDFTLISSIDFENLSIDFNSLLESINQSVPIVLSINDFQKQDFSTFAKIDSGLKKEIIPLVNLFYNNQLIATLKNAEIYPHRKRERIHRQFGFYDVRHPSINLINQCGDWLIGGDIEINFYFLFDIY